MGYALEVCLAVLITASVGARVLRSQDSGLWQPSDGTSRADWLRCHGFPCGQWERTQSKVTKLKYMAHANGERTRVSESQVPIDSDASDDSLDGCIWLTDEQIDGVMEELKEGWKAEDGERKIRKKRKLGDFSNYLYGLWDMPITWKFDGNHNYLQRQTIRGAFDHMEQQTCARFNEIGVNEDHTEDHLLITRENTGCHSFIGHIGQNTQQINLQDACVFAFGTIVHEIGHALGLWHEQQRSDRDQHIRLQESNIGYYAGQFVKQKTVSLGVPYDVGSVMHYDSYAGSSNGQRTMVTLDPWEQSSLGQRTGLSFLDAKIINFAYCSGVCRDKLRRSCLHGGYQDPNDCSRCKCPDGFSGDFCEALARSNVNCGAEIRLRDDGSEEFINSPNYSSDRSGSYNNQDECNWRATAPDGYHVRMEFVDKFSVYCHYAAQCYHWVEVKYNQETLDEGNQGARFCCYSRPTAAITSEDKEMVITLRANWTSTSSSYRSGFKARLVAVPDPSVTRGSSTTVSTTTTTTKVPTRPPTTLSTSTTTKPSINAGCEKMDLVFVLDSSGSVMAANWKKVLRFAQDIIKYLPITQSGVRVGLVSYGNSATTHIYLDDHSEEMLLAMSIERIAFKDQWTNTGAGLRMGRRTFERTPRNVHKVIVMITDGESNRDARRTIPEAVLTRDAGIEIVALAVGSEANLEEAEDITGRAENVLNFDDFVALQSSDGTTRVLNHICSDDMMLGPNESENPEWSCSFEDNGDPLCGMDQASNDVFDWTRWTGSTPSQETGPSAAYDGSHYLYIEASRPRKYGDTAQLRLPAIIKSGTKCFQFHFNMHGFHVNCLELYSLTSDGNRSLLWERSGDSGDRWRESVVEAQLNEGDRLILVGIVGMEYSGDIAIDNLELFDGTCAV